MAPISAALFRHWFFALLGLMATQKPPGQECTVPRWVQFFTLYSLAGLIFFAAGLAAQAVRESTHRSRSSFFIKTLSSWIKRWDRLSTAISGQFAEDIREHFQRD